MQLVGEYKRAEAQLVSIVQQIDRLRVYREYGFTSTFDYVVKALGLSESCAYNLIAVSRKTSEIPEIQVALDEGRVTVSKVKKVLTVMTPENQAEWLTKVESLPQRKLELEVAKIAPLEVSQERVRVLTASVRELKIPVDERLLEKLERVKDLNKTESFGKALEILADFYLGKRDPSRRTGLKTSSKSENRSKAPKSIPAAIRREVLKRDDARCTYIDFKGVRCANTRYIEIHHVTPRAWGGAHQPGNLAVLCSQHHSMAHEFLGS